MTFVCKAESISYGKAALRYAELRTLKDMNENTGKYDVDTHVHIAKELMRKNLFEGLTPDECIGQMKDWKEITGHSNIKNDFFWISINPSADTCEQLENGGIALPNGERMNWDDVCNDYLRRMGLENTMAIAVTHDRTDKKDKGRKHIHILVSRIDMDGKLISDNYIGRKSRTVADQMSEAMGMQIADNLKSDKKRIRSIAIEELSKLKKFDFLAFIEALRNRGVVVNAYKDKAGNIKGFKLSMDGKQFYKLSQVDRGLTMSHIENTHKGILMSKAAMNILSCLPEYSFENYKFALHERGIDMEVTPKGYKLFVGDSWHQDVSLIDKRLSKQNLEKTYRYLHQTQNARNYQQTDATRKNSTEYKPDYSAIARGAGVKSVRIRKKYDGNYYAQLSMTNGMRTAERVIDRRDGYYFESGRISRAEVAVKNFFQQRSGDDGGSRFSNREWEIKSNVSWEVDDEQALDRRYGLSR